MTTSAKTLWTEALRLQAAANLATKQAVRAALEESGWLERRAANLLGMPRSTFRALVERLGLYFEAKEKRLKLVGPFGGRPSDTFGKGDKRG